MIAPRARTPPVAADQAVLQDVHRLRVPPRKAVGVHGLSQQYQQLRRFEFCNQIRNGTLSADTVRQFYEQAEIDYEELAELIAELDMAGPMKRFWPLMERRRKRCSGCFLDAFLLP